MDGNRQKKGLVVECKALKWVNANSAPPKGSPFMGFHSRGDDLTSPSQLR